MKLILATISAITVVPLCFAQIVLATSPDAPMHSEKTGAAKIQEEQKLRQIFQAEENVLKPEASAL